MGCQVHQSLRTLCVNTEWKYAVFWKLKLRARMMLTWEDAFYASQQQHNPSECKRFSEMEGNLHDECYSQDPLGLAVAKMSYKAYSLGEGIIGQVAVTGKHMWIFSDKYETKSSSSFVCIDEWQTLFLAGIRTIAVVAVVPHGVVQLGSLNEIAEDLKMVNHIRESFFGFQYSLVECMSGAICSMESASCPSDMSTRYSGSGIFQDSMHYLDSIKDPINMRSPMFPSLGKTGDCSSKTIDAKNILGAEESENLPQTKSDTFLADQPKELQTKFVSEGCELETSGFRGVLLEDSIVTSSNNSLYNKTRLSTIMLTAVNSVVDVAYLASADVLDSTGYNNQEGEFCMPKLSGGPIQKGSIDNIEIPSELDQIDMLNASFRFSAGCELYEALGPAFQKHNPSSGWEATRTETRTSIQMPEVIDSSSLLTTNSGSENLLEAVVANVCYSDVKIKNSFGNSVKSVLESDKILGPFTNDYHANCSASCSYDQPSLKEKDVLHCLTSSGTCGASLNSSGAYDASLSSAGICAASLNSSGSCGFRSSRAFSSRSPSKCNELLERPNGPGKINKKRAKPGENCRPRPRDRQLIQDRIKELREIVPNGSKCSIDSLLERTVKHMLFMQSITKHADKLSKCGELKLLDKKIGVGGQFNYDRGSSWAVEVGSHLKVCPIIVENLNVNGQMLVEMICEDCCNFLEIAEAIRSLGLTILKGVTEAYGEKTWMSFVVEGQNNRNMHRMDILWSLVQILQPMAET